AARAAAEMCSPAVQTFSREALRSYGRSFQLISPIEAAVGSQPGAGHRGAGDRRSSFAFSAAAAPFVSVAGAIAGPHG
ncbi:unnamed protein product, partial [Prorocentrum cordatum]